MVEPGQLGSEVATKLNLVDLAGMESSKKSFAVEGASNNPARREEAKNINVSLYALGTVIWVRVRVEDEGGGGPGPGRSICALVIWLPTYPPAPIPLHLSPAPYPLHRVPCTYSPLRRQRASLGAAC